MENTNNATPKQLQSLHAILHSKGLLAQKPVIISSATNGRSISSKDLTYAEADELIKQFNNLATGTKPSKQMMGKLFAIAHEMGYVNKDFKANAAGKLIEVNNYNRLYGWVLKYGYLKKELNLYTHAEFPKLLTQFEMGVYQQFLKQKK